MVVRKICLHKRKNMLFVSKKRTFLCVKTSDEIIVFVDS